MGSSPSDSVMVLSRALDLAGDVLAGVVAAGIDRGLPLMPAVRWAVAAASQKVTRRGTSSGFPTADELAALAPAMDLP